MIYLTFNHTRAIFKKNEFAPWIKRLFPDGARFEGTSHGNYEPTIAVKYTDFEKVKNDIPTKNLIRIRGSFNVIEYLAFGVRYFDNSLIKTTS